MVNPTLLTAELGLNRCRTRALQERELCAHVRLLPAQYLLLKAALIRESAARGGLARADVRAMFRLEPAQAQRVFDLLLSCGTATPLAVYHQLASLLDHC